MSISIPAFQVSSPARARGKGDVFVASRKTGGGTGIFHADMDVHFDPAADDYPSGSLTIKTDLNDGVKGSFFASTIELMQVFGEENPTIVLTGQCTSDTFTRAPLHGCRYWIMVMSSVKDGHGTSDFVSFCIQDRRGICVAYGSGV